MPISYDFDEGKFRSSFLETAREGMKQSVEKRLQEMRCPEHNQIPHIEVVGSSMDELQVVIEPCCEAFKKTIEDRLAAES